MFGTQRQARFAVIAQTILIVLTARPAAAQTPAQLKTTIAAGQVPVAIAVNPFSNKIYVANQTSNNVTVIDGATNNTNTIYVGAAPDALAVNPSTNKIYVANGNSSTVTVINGATNQTATVRVGLDPVAVAINPVTNKIYVADYCPTSGDCGSQGSQCQVSIIDGATNQVTGLTVSPQQGCHPNAVAVNSASNTIYVVDEGSNDVAVIDGNSNTLLTTVPAGSHPLAVAVDQFTNRIFVANQGANDDCNPNGNASTVTVIDGGTNSIAATVPVGACPVAVAVNPVSSQVYVVNYGDGTTTIINETTPITTATVIAGSGPYAVDVDPATNEAYVANRHADPSLGNTVSVIDGYTASPLPPVLLGGNQMYPGAVVVNPMSNTVYVADSYSNQASVITGASSPPLQFVPVPPCRVADTRVTNGLFGGPYLPGGSTRNFPIPQNNNCNIPNTAVAYSLNVTAVPLTGALRFMTVWPAGELLPISSTLNSQDGRIKANAAIIPAGAGGAVSVYATNATNVILDINGYFQHPTSQTLQFYSLTPCRVFDTRSAPGTFGGPSLIGFVERDFPIPASACQVPANALAYSMNFTVTPVNGQPMQWMSVWAKGQSQPTASTLNNPTATVVANAAIVPAGVNGAIAVYPSAPTQLIGDINGYFALPASGLSLYPTFPCRVIDTRVTGGAFNLQRNPPVNVVASGCQVPSTAQEFVFNATAVPTGILGYLTLWADGSLLPTVSTLNSYDGTITSNMAIVGNIDGAVDAYAAGWTYLILDVSSYFAP